MVATYRWFHFVESGTRTHLVGWHHPRHEWRPVCGLFSARRSQVTYSPILPLCKTCDRLTSDLPPVKASRR
ncbi:MAG: hypothetical protein ACR2ME_04870 [Acidimicrobiia bacterium]